MSQGALSGCCQMEYWRVQTRKPQSPLKCELTTLTL